MNIVEKYGGTSVGTIEQIQAIALHAKHMKEQGHNLVIVASAMGKTTNKLIELAHSVTSNPNKRELDSLLSTGEQQTITLLAIAMNSIGLDAISLTGYQAGFLTSKHHSRALIKDIDTTTIQAHLDQGKVVVVAGFQGATEYGDITTDVDGVYTIDPRLYTRAKKLKSISYEEMMQMACLGAGVLETRSVELASKYNVPLFLGKALETDLEKGTWIMHKELEDMPITGLSVKDDYAIMRFMHLPNDGVYLGKLFKMISDLNINLDTISQQLDDEGLANFTLYCSEEQSNQIMEHASKEYPVHQMLGYIKLSLVGLGISTHSGIASKVLNILSENGIKYYMITSSEISISLTIEKKDKVKAVQALGKAFDL